MANLNKLESFTVYSSSILNIEDINALTLLYNPLIKQEAYNVYMLLSSLVDRASLKSFTAKHQYLFDMTLLNEESFYKARVKLEAIGLLTTLYNDNSYIYILKNPLTAKQFLVDGVLGSFLYSEIGPTSFKQLFKLFNISKVNKENYTNITKNFDDVYVNELDNITIQKEEYLVGRNKNLGVKIEKFNFDYKKFTNNVKVLLDKKKLSSKNLETHITNMAYAYAFDEDIMTNVLKSSIDHLGNIDYALLNTNALDEFHFQYNKTLPKIVEKKQDELYTILVDLSAEMILQKYSKFQKPLVDDVKKIAMIYQEFPQIDRAVLNLSILSIIKKKEGDVPAYNYFKAAITTLIKNNCTDFDNAKKYYFGEKTNDTKGSDVNLKARTITKNSKNPDWLNKSLDNIMDGVKTL